MQLCSFEYADKSRALRAKLLAANYRTYIIEAETENGKTLRVLVGPMLDKDALEQTATEIEAGFGLQGRILRYNIQDDKGQIGG